jgi:hypothetical protein
MKCAGAILWTVIGGKLSLHFIAQGVHVLGNGT